MERLEFRLLGFPEFRLNGRRVELAPRRAAALLITLAEACGPVARDVAATLWPEADEEADAQAFAAHCVKIPIAFRSGVIAASGASLSPDRALSVEAGSSPGAVAGLLEALRDTDVRHLPAKVSAMTVVLHRSGDAPDLSGPALHRRQDRRRAVHRGSR
jgi:hypothetical protein